MSLQRIRWCPYMNEETDDSASGCLTAKHEHETEHSGCASEHVDVWLVPVGGLDYEAAADELNDCWAIESHVAPVMARAVVTAALGIGETS